MAIAQMIESTTTNIKLINLTDHEIVLLDDDAIKQDEKRKTFLADPNKIRIKLTIPSSIKDNLPRAVEEKVTSCWIQTDNETLVRISAPSMILKNLPPEQKGVMIIASQWVASLANAQERFDVLAPSKIVRSKDNPGKILGCLELGTVKSNPIFETRDSHCASCGAWGGTPLGDAYYGINVEEQAFHDSGICPMCDGFYESTAISKVGGAFR